MRKVIAALLILIATPCAAEISVADFVRDDDVRELSISPDGQLLAVAWNDEDASLLNILDLSTLNPVSNFRLGKNQFIDELRWANPKRLVLSIAEKNGSLEVPLNFGELMAVDADGKNGRYLFGFRAAEGAGSLGRAKHFEDVRMIGARYEDPQHILIVTDDQSGDRREYVEKLDVSTGHRDVVTVAPFDGTGSFAVDIHGEPRYAFTLDVDNKVHAYSRDTIVKDWKEFDFGGAHATRLGTWAYLSRAEDGVYFEDNQDRDKTCLWQFKPASGKREQLACSRDADLGDVIMGFDGRDLLGAVFESAQPAVTLFNSDPAGGGLYASIAKNFPGQFVDLLSSTQDGSRSILFVRSDRNPGEYYLYDRETKQVRPLLSRRPWIKAADMLPMRPIEFGSRDGMIIHGYLTVPNATSTEKPPLVVIPHGGPIGIRDRWAWDSEHQLLASRGYAVLSVNFRGSGGFGEKHEKAGYRQYGKGMIDDITDAVRWATGNGFADPARICIYGASYGGYAALTSAVREPDLYRCVASLAGPYDLNAQWSDADYTYYEQGRRAFRERTGDNKKDLADQSPITHLDRLKAAVFLAHGEEDRRVPFGQFVALRKAMDKRQIPYEWLAKPGEGHGFYKQANREEFYDELLRFLDRNIGDHAAKK